MTKIINCDLYHSKDHNLELWSWSFYSKFKIKITERSGSKIISSDLDHTKDQDQWKDLDLFSKRSVILYSSAGKKRKKAIKRVGCPIMSETWVWLNWCLDVLTVAKLHHQFCSIPISSHAEFGRYGPGGAVTWRKGFVNIVLKVPFACLRQQGRCSTTVELSENILHNLLPN